MGKRVWILNHYASNMAISHGGRHYWFARHLQQKGYTPVIFCANTLHNSSEIIEVKNGKFVEQYVDGVKFIFVKTTLYDGNSFAKIRNMVMFSVNLYKVAMFYAQKYNKPDIILASSVHPLTLIAGEKTAEKLGIKCICEIRDLWPESIVAYGLIKENSWITKIMYYFEKKYI